MFILNIILITRNGAEGSGVGSDNTILRVWIVVEVSLTLLEELSGIITQITDRLVFWFEEWIAAITGKEEAGKRSESVNKYQESLTLLC